MRSRVALGLTAAAARGRLELQVCQDCGATQYPPREVCGACLSHRLIWRPQDGCGELTTETVLRTAQELFFRERTPWRVGTVRLDAGVNVIAYVHERVGAAPCRVRVAAALDRAGQAVLVALPEHGDGRSVGRCRSCAKSPAIRASRKVLITDGKSAPGQAIARALAAAGAELIWIGHSEPWKKSSSFEALRELPQAKFVPLDVTDGRSVRELAGEIGAKVDILINTADCHRTFSIAARRGVETAPARDGGELFRPAAARPGIRADHESARSRWAGERGRLGQPAVHLRSFQLSAARDVLGLEGGRIFAVAGVAGRAAATLACA